MCVCAQICACMHVCACAHLSACVYLCQPVCACAHLSACLCVSVSACVYLCQPVCDLAVCECRQRELFAGGCHCMKHHTPHWVPTHSDKYAFNQPDKVTAGVSTLQPDRQTRPTYPNKGAQACVHTVPVSQHLSISPLSHERPKDNTL